MFWDKKEDKPKLPELPPLKFDDSGNKEMAQMPRHNLPSFPDSAQNKGFSQAAIKDAISQKEENAPMQEFPNFPDDSDSEVIGDSKDKDFKTVEMEEWTPDKKLSEDISKLKETVKPKVASPKTKNADIFVKIDKFYSIKKALGEAKQNLEDIDEMLKKIREIKMREEQELTSWEKEISNVKSRIQEVTENIFEKVD